MIKILLLLIISHSIGQANELNTTHEKYIEEMQWLYSANLENDFEQAIKNKDFRFVGIYGYSLYVPGVKIQCLNEKNEVKPIKGTTDSAVNHMHAQLIELAIKYAKDYNLRMKYYREKNQGFECKF